VSLQGKGLEGGRAHTVGLHALLGDKPVQQWAPTFMVGVCWHWPFKASL